MSVAVINVRDVRNSQLRSLYRSSPTVSDSQVGQIRRPLLSTEKRQLDLSKAVFTLLLYLVSV